MGTHSVGDISNATSKSKRKSLGKIDEEAFAKITNNSIILLHNELYKFIELISGATEDAPSRELRLKLNDEVMKFKGLNRFENHRLIIKIKINQMPTDTFFRLKENENKK